MKMRLLALSHLQEGKSRTEISKFLKVSRTSVNKWVNIFLNEGIEGLKEKPRTGALHFYLLHNKNNLLNLLMTRREVMKLDDSPVLISMRILRQSLIKHITLIPFIIFSKKWAFHG